MKYLKRFNEELKPQTYMNAARKLKNKGHLDRAETLNQWANKVEQDEELKKWENLLPVYSKFGIFKIKVVNPETGKSLVGDFVVDIFFDADCFEDTHSEDGGTFVFFINIIPTSLDLLNECRELMPCPELNGGGYPGMILGLDYSISGGEVSIDKYNLDFYDDGLSGEVYLADRPSANRFKSLFKKILTDSNLAYPSGYLGGGSYSTEIYDVLEGTILVDNSFSSEYGFKLEDIANYINSINANDLYKS